eukprot:8641885-Ditylum_brightwellii.AAC.1
MCAASLLKNSWCSSRFVSWVSIVVVEKYSVIVLWLGIRLWTTRKSCTAIRIDSSHSLLDSGD